MGSKFLSGGTADLTDGTAEINIRTATIQSLLPNLPVRTSNSRQLTSGLIGLSDLSFTPLATPYPGTIQARDFITKYDTTPIDLNTYLGTNDTNISTLQGDITTLQGEITTLQTATQHITADASNTNINCTNTNVTGTNFLWNGQQVATVGAPGAYLPLAGGTMAGDINMNTHDVTNAGDLTFNGDIQIGKTIVVSNPSTNILIGDSSSSTAANTAPVVCIGQSAIIDGYGSIAIGTTAKGGLSASPYCVSLGYNASTTGTQSMAAGLNATASGPGVVSLGTGATSGTGSTSYDIAIGRNSTAYGGASIALGQSSVSNELNAVAIGQNSTGSAANAIALGSASTSSGVTSISLGSASITSSTSSIAIGTSANSSAASGIAIGSSSACPESNAVAIGPSSSCNGTGGGIALGLSSSVATTTGGNNIAIGNNASVTGSSVQNAIAIGASANNNISRSVLLGDPSVNHIRANSLSCVLGTSSVPFEGLIVADTTTGVDSTGRLNLGPTLATSIVIGKNGIQTTINGVASIPLIPFGTVYDTSGFTVSCSPATGILAVSNVTMVGQINSTFTSPTPGVLQYTGTNTSIFDIHYDITFSSSAATSLTWFNSINRLIAFSSVQTQARQQIISSQLNEAIHLHFSDVITLSTNDTTQLAVFSTSAANLTVNLMSLKVTALPIHL